MLEKIFRGLRGVLRALREGPWPPWPPLGYVTGGFNQWSFFLFLLFRCIREMRSNEKNVEQGERGRSLKRFSVWRSNDTLMALGVGMTPTTPRDLLVEQTDMLENVHLLKFSQSLRAVIFFLDVSFNPRPAGAPGFPRPAGGGV